MKWEFTNIKIFTSLWISISFNNHEVSIAKQCIEVFIYPSLFKQKKKTDFIYTRNVKPAKLTLYE